MPIVFVILIGIGVGAVGLALFVLGWLFDRSWGRRRCRKCWHRMDHVSDDDAVGSSCPECGRTCKRLSELYRARRHRGMIALGVVMMVSGGLGPGLYRNVRDNGALSVVPMPVLVWYDGEGAAAAWFDDVYPQLSPVGPHWLEAEIGRRIRENQMSPIAWRSWYRALRKEAERLQIYGVPGESRLVYEQLAQTKVDLGGRVRTFDSLADVAGVLIHDGLEGEFGASILECSGSTELMGLEAADLLLIVRASQSGAGAFWDLKDSEIHIKSYSSQNSGAASAQRTVIYDIADIVTELRYGLRWSEPCTDKRVDQLITTFLLASPSANWFGDEQIIFTSSIITHLFIEERLAQLRALLGLTDSAAALASDSEARASWRILEQTVCSEDLEHRLWWDVLECCPLPCLDGYASLDAEDRMSELMSDIGAAELSVAEMFRMWEGSLANERLLHISPNGSLMYGCVVTDWENYGGALQWDVPMAYSLSSLTSAMTSEGISVNVEEWDEPLAAEEMFDFVFKLLSFDTLPTWAADDRLHLFGDRIVLDAPFREHWEVDSVMRRYVRMRCGDKSVEQERRASWEQAASEYLMRIELFDVGAILQGWNDLDAERRLVLGPTDEPLVELIRQAIHDAEWLELGGWSSHVFLQNDILVVDAPIRVQRQVIALLEELQSEIDAS